ncbi:MAG: histidine kinase [Oscillospiraceae bacterium]|nr:histidine kinase [Oscillospiraceae bacterium]
MKKLTNFWQASAMRTKLIIALLFTSLPPLLLAQSILSSSYQAALKEKIVSSEQVSSSQTARIFDIKVGAYRDLLISIISDDDIVAGARMLNAADDTYNSIMGKVILKQAFTSYLSQEPGILSISLLREDGTAVSFNGDASRMAEAWSGLKALQTSIYRSSVSQPGMHISDAHVDQRKNKTVYLLHMSNRLLDPLNLEPLGVIVLTIDESMLTELLIPQQQAGSRCFLVMDSTGRVVSAEDKRLLGLNFSTPVYLSDEKDLVEILTDVAENQIVPAAYTTDFHTALSSQEGCQVLISNLPTPRWYLVNVLDNDYLYSSLYSSQRLFFGLTLLICCAIVLIALYFSSSLSRSAKEIARVMDLARKGDLGVQVSLDTKDEMEIVAQSFNRMMQEILALTETLRAEKDRTAQAIAKEKDAEIKALTAQINPHFLYNTLDTINWALIENEQYESSKMITALSSILRYSISTKTFLVTVEEEFEWLRKYVYLRQCATDNFRVSLHMDPRIARCHMYKLLLQPVVENAITHGFEGFISGGMLEISFTDISETRMQIVVQDNGQGMGSHTLEAVSQGSYQSESSHGIGVSNVLTRLKMYYGEAADLQIKSSRENGTRITFLLPKL